MLLHVARVWPGNFAVLVFLYSSTEFGRGVCSQAVAPGPRHHKTSARPWTRPSLQIMMKVASQRFSTRAGFRSILSKWFPDMKRALWVDSYRQFVRHFRQDSSCATVCCYLLGYLFDCSFQCKILSSWPCFCFQSQPWARVFIRSGRMIRFSSLAERAILLTVSVNIVMVVTTNERL